MVLGQELSRNGTIGEPIGLPSEVWDRHLLISGQTGAGKTTTATTALTTAHPHTDGPTIVLDPKGAGWLDDLARAHYRRTGSLDDVWYFDIAEFLPALSPLDIRRDLDADIPRHRAVQDIAEHVIGLLDYVKPAGFDAIRSPDVIRYLLSAQFDPANGADAVPLADLVEDVYDLREDGVLPDVSMPRNQELLDSLTTGKRSTLDQIMQGAVTRLEKLSGDGYLRPLFNHAPDDPQDAFAFDDWLAEDVLILVDLSGPTDRTQRVLANMLLAQLWRALRRRRKRHPTADLPLCLLAIDELPHLRIESHLESMLTMGREYGIGLISLCQAPVQLKRQGTTSANMENTAYHELLNNSHTILTGAVSDDEGLVKRLSGSHMSEGEAENRLRNLPASRWFFKPATSRGTKPIKSHTIADPPLPPGHPDGPAPLAATQQADFEESLTACRTRTRETYGLTYGGTQSADKPADDSQPDGTQYLPLVNSPRFPDTVGYDASARALVCQVCQSRYNPTPAGMRRVIACCGDPAAVARDNIPMCQVPLKLTEAELTATEWSLQQLAFLQAVHTAQQQRFDPTLEYDIVFDSMLRLKEYLAIDDDAIDELCEAGLVTDHGNHPHRLYSVPPAGRTVLNEHYRKGVDFGHGKGDLRESSEHILLTEVGRRYLESAYVDDPKSPVVTVVPYYELGDDETTVPAAAAMGTETDSLDETVRAAERRRLDVAGIDADGSVVVAVEAQRTTNDLKQEAPADFDKMAACDVEEAIWIVMRQAAGHEVLEALHDPAEGRPRVKTTYAETTPPRQMSIDTSGLTEMYTVTWLRKQLTEPTLS